MKKFLLLLAVASIFAVGCQTDNTSDNAVNVGDGTTLTISLPQTRTSLGGKVGDTYPVYWSEGDKIVVNGTLSEEVKINSKDKTLASFGFSNGLPSTPYHITLPYCSATSTEQAVVEFPAEQEYTEGTYAVGSVPMCGYLAGGNNRITLNHLATILRVPVKAKFDGAALEKVVLTAENSVTGEYNVDCQNVAITATENVGNVVTYTLPANFALSSSTESVLHIVLPAVEVGACTIEFIEKGGEKMVATWTPEGSLPKGVVREFKTVTYAPKTTTVLTSFEAVADEFEIFYEKVYGYVKYSDGSPIANVAVSDGFQVVTTDENGYYELKGVTPNTWYIYCSLPADVEVPIDELGRPGFFQKYPSNSPQYDFTFEKLPGGVEKEFAIFAMADPQVGSIESINRWEAQAIPEIKSYSQSLNIPCYGVVLGDIVGDTIDLFDEMRATMAYEKSGMPIFAVFGNHDDFYSRNYTSPIFPDDRNSSQHLKVQRPFEECFGPVDYSFNRGNTHIICMRDVYEYTYQVGDAANYSSGFTDEQYEWLQQDLALVTKDKTVILCVHIPLFNSNTIHIQDTLALLDEFAESHILSGHLHYRRCYDYTQNGYNNMYEQSWSSVAVIAYGNGVNINCDGVPTGYGVMTFRDGKMVKSIHKGYAYGMNDENYQIRLHRGGDITGAAIPEGDANKNGTKGYYQFGFDENTILANVFSSDPYTWSVEVWEYDEATGKRGNLIGNMSSLHRYHNKPAYEDLVGDGTFENPKRPADGVISGREFWTVGVLLGHLGSSVNSHYHECHTLWRLSLSEEYADAKVMVVARDKWGNEYTQTEFQVGTDITHAIYDPANNPVVE